MPRTTVDDERVEVSRLGGVSAPTMHIDTRFPIPTPLSDEISALGQAPFLPRLGIVTELSKTRKHG